MIEEHKIQTEKNAIFPAGQEYDVQSIKSHKSGEVDNVSLKSIRSCVSNIFHNANLQNQGAMDYPSVLEENSQEDLDEDASNIFNIIDRV